MCIKIHFYLIIFCVYLYAVHKLSLFLIFYLFIFLHELSHVIIAFLLKVEIKEILLLPAGVTAKYNDNNLSYLKEIVIALIGPIFSIIIAFILKDTVYFNMNIFIAIINLIPIYPLDGGRIFKCVIEMIFGYKKSRIICEFIFKIMATLLVTINIFSVIYFKNYTAIIFLIYFVFITIESVKQKRIKDNLREMLNLT